MGHTYQSQKPRSKRPDGRPVSAKARMKIYAKQASQATIQDLRVTSKQKHERKERETSPRTNGEMRKSAAISSDEKILRALRKKLTQIEGLLKKQSEGIELDDAQVMKVETMESVIEEMEEVSARMRIKDQK